MASSSSYPLSEIPQELKDLFSWNPPALRARPGMKKQTSTRRPAFFEKHFSDDLKLRQVKRLPSLVHDITAIVDKTIIDSFSDGVQLPPSKKWYSAEAIDRAVEGLQLAMRDEKAVASFYDKTTATFCVPVASSLAFGIPGLLEWTQSANVSGYAIADGFLTFINLKDLADRGVQFEEVMDEETVELFRLLAGRSSSLLTNEFKNPAVGGPEVMLAIPNLSNSPSFDWTTCDVPECASMAKHDRERGKGPDAKNTPWTFDSRSNNSMFPSETEAVRPQHPTLRQPRQIGEIAPASASAQLPASVPSSAVSTGSSSVQGSSEDAGTNKAVKRKRDDGSSNQSRANPPLAPEASSVPEILPQKSPQLAKKQKQDDPINPTTSLMPPPPLPVGGVQVETAFPKGKGKGKAVVKGKAQDGGDDQDGDDECDDEGVDDPSHKDNHDLSAQFIVQQAWAQATRVDGSIIVLHSGNYELIGIRHRNTQTLYVSDLIKPHACKEPSYGKLHVGLYIAAIRDALDRERQALDARPPGGGNGPSGGVGDTQDGPSGGGPGSGHRGDRGGGRKGDHRDEGGGSKKPKQGGNQRGKATGSIAKRMVIAAREMAAKENTLKLASSRNVILLYLQYGIYDSSAPSTFVRSGPIGQAPIPLPSRETVLNYRLEECLTIVLKSEIGHGATGEVLRGTLEVEASACELLDVAVKLALASEQRDALRHEYTIYHRLTSSGVTAGITTPFGLFDDVEGGVCILVMPYVGIPLAAMPELVLPISYREAVLATLAEIHNADVLHGDLRLDNILVADSGLQIIDFSHSQMCYDQDAKNNEYSRLQSLLDRREK